jgi:hypothetical protein
VSRGSIDAKEMIYAQSEIDCDRFSVKRNADGFFGVRSSEFRNIDCLSNREDFAGGSDAKSQVAIEWQQVAA